MISLCYVSSSKQRFEKEQLINLLRTCHKNNKAIDITGLLLYNGQGTFMQVLEGEQEDVISLYETIKQDPRHSRIHCISKQTIQERDFPNWKMGFRNLSDTPLDCIDGLSDFMQQQDASDYIANNPSFAYTLLSHFKDKTNELVL